MDPLVKVTSVRDSPQLDARTGQPMRFTLVTFMVGTHGPFTLSYQVSEYNADRVSADIQAEVDTLRAIGAIPAAV